MSVTARIRIHVLATAALILGTSGLSLQSAQAELPEPEPMPGDAIAPVFALDHDSSALHAPVFSPEGGSSPLYMPVHGMEGAWNRVVTEEGDQLTLSGEVHFDKHEATLSDTAIGILDELAAEWAEAAPQTVRIVGHTDTDGESGYNQDLSERRAQAVADHLQDQAPGVTFEVSGKGESEPLADESEGSEQEQAEAKDANRRVVITIPDG